MKKNGKNGKFNLRSIAIAVLVILFFEGVIAVYYSKLYSETRERIIKNGELSSETSAEQINRYDVGGQGLRDAREGRRRRRAHRVGGLADAPAV